MIQKIEINSVHAVLTDDLKKYITRKIAKLDRYMPLAARSSAHAEVFIKEQKSDGKKECICEVVLHVPGDTIRVAEGTVNMFAAVDIVEYTLRNRLKKYKDLHASPKLHRRVIARFRKNNESALSSL